MIYLVIAKKSEDGYTAKAARFPNCVTTGKTLDEVGTKIKQMIEDHLVATGTKNGEFEVFVSEDLWQERKKGDGLDDIINQMVRERDDLVDEEILNTDLNNLQGWVSSEEMMRELDEIEQGWGKEKGELA